LKADLSDTFIILHYKGTPISSIGSALADKGIIAKKASFEVVFGGAFSVFKRSTAAEQPGVAIRV